MYISAINDNYAPSSTSKNRTSFYKLNLLFYFKNNKINFTYNI